MPKECSHLPVLTRDISVLKLQTASQVDIHYLTVFFEKQNKQQTKKQAPPPTLPPHQKNKPERQTKNLQNLQLFKTLEWHSLHCWHCLDMSGFYLPESYAKTNLFVICYLDTLKKKKKMFTGGRRDIDADMNYHHNNQTFAVILNLRWWHLKHFY